MIEPERWILPQLPLPEEFLSFLGWCDGGWTRTGDREFGFFGLDDPRGGIREMTLAYQFPHYMPGALPFALNGCGCFYIFDMRHPSQNGHYPILASHSGNLGWNEDECWHVADSFQHACEGSVNIEAMRPTIRRMIGAYDALEMVSVYLENPVQSLRTLLSVKQELGLIDSVHQIKAKSSVLPCCLKVSLAYHYAIRVCLKINEFDPCLGIRLLRDESVHLPIDSSFTW